MTRPVAALSAPVNPKLRDLVWLNHLLMPVHGPEPEVRGVLVLRGDPGRASPISVLWMVIILSPRRGPLSAATLLSWDYAGQRAPSGVQHRSASGAFPVSGMAEDVPVAGVPGRGRNLHRGPGGRPRTEPGASCPAGGRGSSTAAALGVVTCCRA